MISNESEPAKPQKSLLAKSEAELATYQTRQTGNNCSFHAISVGIQLLLNYKIDPSTLAQEINRQWWRGKFMRVIPNWAVTPQMQVRIIQYLAESRNLPIRATYLKGTLPKLEQFLSNPTAVPIITLVWLWGQAPPIYYADSAVNVNQTDAAQGHTMVVAAYDPYHFSGGNLHTPWGFINSWRSHARNLYWMSEEDFSRVWGTSLPIIGANPLVLLQSTQFNKED